MCIRDRLGSYGITLALLNQTWYSQYERVPFHFFDDNAGWLQIDKVGHAWTAYIESYYICLLYTSDAADERSSVDLGGRRIIKKKKDNKLMYGGNR